MKKIVLKKRARISGAQRRVQNLIARLRTLENECSDEEWANVVAACREAQRNKVSESVISKSVGRLH
jgi:division protein CdvB (Snf7/Vps24/ESCRT-III family)